jgi:uroporphyrinogen III methyltransferase/synthase
MGKVYLIGAGPGDEELMTIKAARVLNSCTAVLYDRLAGGNILKYINDDCEIYYCGKEPGSHYKTQDEINELMVSLAKNGHTVGRIKGGDPYVFGRGGEEALKLVEEDISFEVIPGITSAIAVLNYAGIPVTHRGMAQSFHVFTGKSAEKLNADWGSIAKVEGTLIFLMGLENLEGIVGKLLENGKAADTPAAVIMRGTTAKQRKVTGTVQNIYSKSVKAGFKSPCITVVGETVSLGEKLNWFEKLPCFGLNVCVTRTKEQAKPLTEKLLSLGAEVTEINSIEIKETAYNLDQVESRLSEYNFIVFTSANSVNIFFRYLIDNGIDIRRVKGKFAAVGPATNGALKDRGIIPEITAEEFAAEDLLEKLKPGIKAGDKILLPCSGEARTFLKEELEKLDADVDRIHIYEPVLGQLKNPRAFEDVDVILFTSPSTVRNMINLLGLEAIKDKVSIAIGPITERELRINGIEAFVCQEHSTDGIIKKLIELKGEIRHV